MSPFLTALGNAATAVEGYLTVLLDNQQALGAPERLGAATRHAVLGGGKRFRPFLVLQAAALFGARQEAALPAAAAIECIHCYSLVHDDLPAMDNDELRRGQPTVWKAYDEWTAILVGDALQALAFEALCDTGGTPNHEACSKLVRILAQASGINGMVGGQALDLAAGKIDGETEQSIDSIVHMQSLKTGRLISVSCEMGAVVGGASAEDRAALQLYSEHLGIAFQIRDDLIDVLHSSASAGKATGKDAAQGKATIVGLLGIEAASAALRTHISAAQSALSLFGTRGEILAEAAHSMSVDTTTAG